MRIPLRHQQAFDGLVQGAGLSMNLPPICILCRPERVPMPISLILYRWNVREDQGCPLAGGFFPEPVAPVMRTKCM